MLAVLLILAAPPALGTLVSGAGYQGIVVSCTSAPIPSCWEPSSEQVAALETRLASSVKRLPPRGLSGLLRPPLEYRRQYWGVTQKDGARFIYVIGYHQSQRVVTSGQWKEALTSVAGGGGYYFSGRFAVADSRFTSLSINAPE